MPSSAACSTLRAAASALTGAAGSRLLSSSADLRPLLLAGAARWSISPSAPHRMLPHGAQVSYSTHISTATPGGAGTPRSETRSGSAEFGSSNPEPGSDVGQLHVTVEPLSGPHEGVSVISLTRADARNAIGRQLLRELAEALDVVRQERTTRCVLLRSAVPGVFCAGADLKERATMTQSEAAEFVSRIRGTFTKLQDLPMPSVAVLEGLALGGGAELALACDLRIMGAGAALAFPEAQLGIIPGAGGTQRLPRVVGASKAKELIFTGRRVGGGEAGELRLADHVVPDGQVYARALELAADIVRSAPLSLRQAKAAINRGMDVDLHSGLAIEEAMYAPLLHTRDRLEGLKAFAEKRRPVYTGE